jgi:hypothetical protein
MVFFLTNLAKSEHRAPHRLPYISVQILEVIMHYIPEQREYFD